MTFGEVRKTAITVLGVVVSVGTLVLHEFAGFLPASWAAGISAVVGVATIILNYAVPNVTTDPQRAQQISAKVIPLRRPRTTPGKHPHPKAA